MALNLARLQRAAGAGYGQLHIYQTADTIAVVTAADYFNAATNQLRQHDIIMVVSETGGVAKIDNIIVTSASGAASVTTSATEGVTVS